MVLDECPPWPIEEDAAAAALERTLGWARRARGGAAAAGSDGALRHRPGRRLSAACASAPRPSSRRSTSTATRSAASRSASPRATGARWSSGRRRCCRTIKPRYLMGVGTPDDILHAVAAGIDLFDCVLPARNGRHGLLFTREGAIRIQNARLPRRPAAARSGVRLPGLPARVARLPAPPGPRRRDHRRGLRHAAQPALLSLTSWRISDRLSRPVGCRTWLRERSRPVAEGNRLRELRRAASAAPARDRRPAVDLRALTAEARPRRASRPETSMLFTLAQTSGCRGFAARLAAADPADLRHLLLPAARPDAQAPEGASEDARASSRTATGWSPTAACYGEIAAVEETVGAPEARRQRAACASPSRRSPASRATRGGGREQAVKNSLLWRGLLILGARRAVASGPPIRRRQKINLGLDLQGGIHLVLQVQTEDAVRAETDKDMEVLRRQVAEDGVAGVRTQPHRPTPASRSPAANAADERQGDRRSPTSGSARAGTGSGAGGRFVFAHDARPTRARSATAPSTRRCRRSTTASTSSASPSR